MGNNIKQVEKNGDINKWIANKQMFVKTVVNLLIENLKNNYKIGNEFNQNI